MVSARFPIWLSLSLLSLLTLELKDAIKHLQDLQETLETVETPAILAILETQEILEIQETMETIMEILEDHLLLSVVLTLMITALVSAFAHPDFTKTQQEHAKLALLVELTLSEPQQVAANVLKASPTTMVSAHSVPQELSGLQLLPNVSMSVVKTQLSTPKLTPADVLTDMALLVVFVRNAPPTILSATDIV